MKIFLFASSRFLGMTNELPLCRGSQQLPQQLIDCGAWMMPRWMQGLVVSTDCSGRSTNRLYHLFLTGAVK